MNVPKHSVRSARLSRNLALVASAALTIALLGSASASAGVYVVAQCDPAKGAGSEASLERSSDHYKGRVTCREGSRGHELWHEGDGTKDGRLAGWSWRAPAGTVLRGVAVEAHMASGGGHVAQLMVGRDDGGADYFGRVENRWRSEFWSGRNGRWFRARLRCYGGSDGLCGRADGAHSWTRSLRFTLEDSSVPALSLSGSLTEPGERIGPQVLAVSAADLGGGVRRAEVSVNGVPAVSRTFACALHGTLGTRLHPCQARATADFRLDTATAPFREGSNELVACVSDLASGGTPNRSCASRTVFVQNLCPSSPGPAVASVEARFAGRNPALLVARHGIRPKLAGALRDAAGQGVPGVRFCVLERVAMAGSPWRRVAMPVTDRTGRFVHALRVGPSRQIRIVHRRDSVRTERTVRLAVQATPKLQVRPGAISNGQRVRFAGTLPGPRNAGRVIALQARDGKRWRTFQTARTRVRGLFSAGYRFRNTNSPTSYRFRALVRPQDGYPYRRGVSRERSVRVG